MSCELTPGQQKILDSLDVLSEGPMAILESLGIPIPTTGQGVAEMLGVGAQYAEVIAKLKSIEDSIKAAIPQIDLPDEIKGLQSEIGDFAKKIINTALAAEDIKDQLDILKSKWGGVDLGDYSIEDIPRLIKSGVLDLQNLCKMVPNYTEEEDETGGVNLIIRGMPTTYPTTNPVAAALGLSFPEIVKPDITIDITRHQREAGERYVNTVIPGIYGHY